MIKSECKLELVSPCCHRRNVADVAIKTFKTHFIAILAGLSVSFPIRLWCKLLPQAELSLNILHPSNTRPNISAYAYLWGQFDFDRTPLTPIGCEVQCHKKASDRRTWAEHTVDGYKSQTHLRHSAVRAPLNHAASTHIRQRNQSSSARSHQSAQGQAQLAERWTSLRLAEAGRHPQ
ncbi:hypothetical protein ACHAWF_003436 [Thalassiosira exigua]